MKQWDAIIIGGGIIGLSLARELNKRGLRVLVVDKKESGREASWAAGGMLADFPLEMPAALRDLARASAQMYPEFVRELEDESRLKIDLRDQGTLLFAKAEANLPEPHLTVRDLTKLEPNLSTSLLAPSRNPTWQGVVLRERSVDPRHLTAAAIGAAKHRGIDFSSGDQVLEVEVAGGRVNGVRTNKTRFGADIVVNCAGAWAGQIGVREHDVVKPGSTRLPTRPVKGQMLCVAMPQREMVRHVIRTPDVYLIPRSDGRMLIGATQEEAGFDKQTVPETIQKLHQAAIETAREVANARILEAWAGLRPGTPDALPILGPTELPSYFVATGHFRDGILLAPVTAKVMGQVIAGENTQVDVAAFSAARFQSGSSPDRDSSRR